MSLTFHERIVIAYFHDVTVIHHDNLVSISYGAQPVGYDNYSAILESRAQSINDFSLVLRSVRVRALLSVYQNLLAWNLSHPLSALCDSM